MVAKKKALTPPDLERCQADVPNGYTFMTLGGRPGLERCKNKPTVIVSETKPGKDGQKGSMSLCDGCLAVLRKQMPRDSFKVEDIDEMWTTIPCDLCEEPSLYHHKKGGHRCASCPRPNE